MIATASVLERDIDESISTCKFAVCSINNNFLFILFTYLFFRQE